MKQSLNQSTLPGKFERSKRTVTAAEQVTHLQTKALL